MWHKHHTKMKSRVDAVPGLLVIGVTNPAAFTNYVTQSNVVRLASSYQNPDNIPVYMNATALFDMNGYYDAVAMTINAARVPPSNTGGPSLR